MWLLHATSFELTEWNSEHEVPGGYAILSHTWGDNEVTFQDIGAGRSAEKNDFKLNLTCQQALKDGFQYVWIDTCCIDKKSSAELSEAINSMYKWYSAASICYVYLSDIEVPHLGEDLQFAATLFDYEPGKRAVLSDNQQLMLPNFKDFKKDFRQLRWFTRGWTLQELIAPNEVKFFDRNFRAIGSKRGLVNTLSEITKIDVEVLADRTTLQSTSVAKRMSWMATRSTSREEDRAYSLLGIFDVNMPLLYGEGRKAFRRLQEEIIRSSSSVDHSILAWKPWESGTEGSTRRYRPPKSKSQSDFYHPLLSPSPYGFRNAHDVVSWSLPQAETFELLRGGLRMSALTKRPSEFRSLYLANDLLDDWERPAGSDENELAIGLNCRHRDSPKSRIVLLLYERPDIHAFQQSRPLRGSSEDSVYDRIHSKWSEPHFLELALSSMFNWSKKTVTLAREPFVWPTHRSELLIEFEDAFCNVARSYPAYCWNGYTSTLTLMTASLDGFGLPTSSGAALEMTPSLWPLQDNILAIRLLPKGNAREGGSHDLSISLVKRRLPQTEEGPNVGWLNKVEEEDWVQLQVGTSHYLERSGLRWVQISAHYFDMAGEVLLGLVVKKLITQTEKSQHRRGNSS